jgi:hypothetical protein
MPYNRPGFMYYAIATVGTHLHGDPVLYDGVAGVAVKQKAVAAGAAAGAATQKAIANGEQFAIISKGIVQLPNTQTGRVGGTALSAIKGSPIYITAAHALTLTSGTNAKFGRCVEVAGALGRGTPTGYMRVDLDKKDSFAAN